VKAQIIYHMDPTMANEPVNASIFDEWKRHSVFVLTDMPIECILLLLFFFLES